MQITFVYDLIPTSLNPRWLDYALKNEDHMRFFLSEAHQEGSSITNRWIAVKEKIEDAHKEQPKGRGNFKRAVADINRMTRCESEHHTRASCFKDF